MVSEVPWAFVVNGRQSSFLHTSVEGTRALVAEGCRVRSSNNSTGACCEESCQILQFSIKRAQAEVCEGGSLPSCLLRPPINVGAQLGGFTGGLHRVCLQNFATAQSDQSRALFMGKQLQRSMPIDSRRALSARAATLRMAVQRG